MITVLPGDEVLDVFLNHLSLGFICCVRQCLGQVLHNLFDNEIKVAVLNTEHPVFVLKHSIRWFIFKK